MTEMNDTAKSRSTFLTLLALKDGPKHGYDIATYIEEKTAAFFKLSFGALYPVLHKLEADGLVEGTWDETEGAKRKKVYTLTAEGRKALDEERERHEATVGAFAKLLGSKG